MAMFEMANATAATEEAAFKRYKFAIADVVDGVATITDANADVTTVQVNGFELVEGVPATGEFAAALATGTMTLTFFAGDIENGTTIEVIYQATETSTSVHILTDSASARGELTMEYPVYSSGTDCTESSTKGFVVITVYRARITALPGFDTSYKTASTNSITMSALDPKRPDKKMYSVNWVDA